MRDELDTHQLWPYACLCCRHVWEVQYTVRRLSGTRGREGEIWLSNGVAVQPPWSDSVCPRCGCQQTTSFPPGYLSRHPELVPAPEPVPEVRIPVIPAQAGRVPAPRAPRARLMLALGLPLVVAVGYELYRVMAAVAFPH
ncbi:hypothetical protein LDL08_40695 [Nonomuraea glycinis]|uniref:Uncharacterized protein n=1 Tax=Nonomuraea glycinis TaxID=2047744 RepID=A0A918ADJ6_9ACTN|nr:hypothetical protein [Nonomuraea glycinis]MCA2182498.1 hypothetical protein [Nonomuraea glycinis]GGP16300.1 hypothetical protein GCM10012278_79590 [Nonomuraea glycinis]